MARRYAFGSAENLADAYNQLRVQAGYNAARPSRYRRTRRNLAPSGSSADYHYRSEVDFFRMMEDSWDMYRNDAVVGQAVDRVVTNVVQDGFKLDVRTGDKKLDDDLQQRMTAEMESADEWDEAQEQNIHGQAEIALRHSIVGGDMIAVGTQNGRVELAEGYRLRTPSRTSRNVVHGVLLNAKRQRVEYWVTKDDINPNASVQRVSDMHRYSTRDEDGVRQVFHVYDPKRLSQTRGVSWFAPIFDPLGMFEDINFAKLVQQQIVSCFAVLENIPEDFKGGEQAQLGEQETYSLGDGTSRTIEGIAPGMRVRSAPGAELSGFSPNVPNPEFFQHVRLILTLVGVNLGLPLVMLLMDASETNFSGWRGAVDQARMTFKRIQLRTLRDRFYRPAYVWKLHYIMKTDPALRSAANRRDGVNVFGHRWHPPTWPYIQPAVDAKADILRQEKLLVARRVIHAERGRDAEQADMDIVEDRKRLLGYAIDAAAELNAKHPDAAVTWRDILYDAPRKRDGDLAASGG